MSKIDETTDLMELYMYATGINQVPKMWYKWSFLSLIAATLGDRVWYQKFEWSRLMPNLYVFLVGPSGHGKGIAIDFALQFEHPHHNLFFGAPTAKAVIDKMVLAPEVCPPNKIHRCAGFKPDPSKMFLVQTELADAVGTGPLADSFVKQMTNFYNLNSRDVAEMTRKNGLNEFKSPRITWLAGTTIPWLRDSVSEASMLSGFLGRTVPVWCWRPWDDRVHKPWVPDDYEDVIGYIYTRIDDLTELSGPVSMTDKAEAADKDWFESRPEPPEHLAAFVEREHDLCLKLAMILSLCDSMDMVIDVRHLLKAQELVGSIERLLPSMLKLAIGDDETRNKSRICDFLKSKANWVSRKYIVQEMAKWNVRAAELEALLYDLKELGDVEEKVTSTTRQYKYKNSGRKFHVVGGKDK